MENITVAATTEAIRAFLADLSAIVLKMRYRDICVSLKIKKLQSRCQKSVVAEVPCLSADSSYRKCH